MAETHEIVTTDEAAKLLGRHRATILRWVEAGRLVPARRLGSARTSALVFHRREIEALRTAQEVRSA